MFVSRLVSTLVLGATLATSGALAQNFNQALRCPSNTAQFGNPKDGVYCRKPGVKDGAFTAHGPYAAYYANGQKSAEGQYVEGFRSGAWTFYTESGQLSERIDFQGGNYHGQRVEYFPNGKPRVVEAYTNGKRDGVVQEFSEDGKLVRQVTYRDGQQLASK